MRRFVANLILAGVVAGGCSSSASDRTPTVAPPPNVTDLGIPLTSLAQRGLYADTLHGEIIPDPWRWLEDSTHADTRAFLAEQTAYSQAVLSRLVGLDSLERLVAGVLEATPTLDAVVPAAGRYYLTRWLGAKPSLLVLDSASRREQILWHADSLAAQRRGAVLRALTPSWNGQYVAVGITENGDERAAIAVLDGTSGVVLPDAIPDLLTTTSGTRYEVTWLPDGSGFFYPRLWPGSASGPAVGKLARGRQFLHRLGTEQSADVPVFGFSVTPGVEMDRDDLPTRIHTAPNSRWLLASLYRVKATGTDWYVAPLIEPLTRPPAWSLLATARDALSAPQLRGDTLYALSHAKDDRGTILRRVLGAPADRPWDTVVPPSEGVIVAFTVQRDGVYYTERKNGRIALRRWRHGDAAASEITVPSGGTVRLVRGQPQEQGVTFYSESWASPPHWQRVATVNGAIAPLPIDDGSRAAVVDELTSTSRVYASVDGTKVPVSVVYSSRALRNGVLDGTAPLLIEAYGAFGRATDPAFNPFAKVWTSLGGVYAYAHVRGGGELGEAWHRAATREHKQRTFDDMIAVIEGLIGERYTAAGRVTLMGISFGANIPGMLLVQRPDLLGTALFEVGQPDEIRGAYFDPTAARNIGELGDLETREGIQLLRQASPYHQVPDSVRLPAVIVHSATGDYNFGSGMLAGKYVARLQAANRGRRPVLWVQTDGGHRSLLGLSPAWAAKALSFSLWQAGMAPYQPRADSSVAGLPDRDPPE